MAKLKAKTRNNLSASKFGLPDTRQYPEEDTGHAKAALSRSSEELAKGNLSPEEAAKIRHKAHAVLGESDSNYHNQ